ncbi:MAG: amidohydrolase/deacetylase family metallohydrolase [Verrucomicrobia bacterium]|nr:amidohydrolase/deacetylase family metallohydrolase [Verrucomicrobiota bacterium]
MYQKSGFRPATTPGPLSRRSFLQHGATAVALAAGARHLLSAQPAGGDFDLLVTGGTVIDSYSDTNKTADVGIKAGRIVAVADRLDRSRATRVLDARGLYVSPGWIDLHAHIFRGVNPLGVDADRDAGVNVGVTTVADPGGFCSDDFPQFRREVVEKSVTRVLGFVNVAAHRSKPDAPMQGDWSLFDQELTIKTVLENRDVIKGVKVLSSVRHAGNLTITPTQLAVQAARETGTHVVAHIGMAPPLIQDVLNLLGPGDIVTHCFKGFPMGIFHRDGRPVAEAWKALERGVRFDLGHGQGSFAWAAGRSALRHHFPLHSLSTDIHTGSVRGPVWTYGRTMAKFLHLGYPLPEVVKFATLGPARLIDEEKELGSLSPGTVADLTLFRVAEKKVVLTDSLNNRETGDRDVEPVHCIRAGKVISEMKIPPAA